MPGPEYGGEGVIVGSVAGRVHFREGLTSPTQ